ncbi:unnamed protein product [Cochlearia groenlandica]
MEKSTPTTTTPATVAAERPCQVMDIDSSPAQLPTPPARGRKRALGGGNLQIENSNYYNMRLLLKDLRPHFLEVLRTPEFRNCKAATEIQEKMKLMLQLYQEMIGESPKREKTMQTDDDSSSLSNGNPINLTTTTIGSETSHVQTENQNTDGDGHVHKVVVVGGSAFGWNFTTSSADTQSVYYGISKEEYRTSHPITPLESEASVELHNTS